MLGCLQSLLGLKQTFPFYSGSFVLAGVLTWRRWRGLRAAPLTCSSNNCRPDIDGIAASGESEACRMAAGVSEQRKRRGQSHLRVRWNIVCSYQTHK